MEKLINVGVPFFFLKVKVMLRVAGDPSSSAFLSVDKKRKQLTLQELQAADSLPSTVDQERRVGVSAPKMFAFDGLFTQENSQVLCPLLLPCSSSLLCLALPDKANLNF